MKSSRYSVLLHALKLDEGPDHHLAGNFRHTEHLVAALSKREELKLTVLCDEYTREPLARHLAPGQLCFRPLHGGHVFAADRAVARAIAELRPDIYHRPSGQLPFVFPKIRAVATIADLNFTVLPMLLVRRLYKELSYRWTVRRADWITCISQFTSDDVVRRLGADPGKLTVIHHGTNELPEPDWSLAETCGPKYWLTFGHQRHKNVEACLQALAKRPGHEVLVIVGTSPYIEDTLKPMARTGGYFNRVKFVGKVSSPALHGLYRRALGLLFVSKYEGFGLPLLEAMQADCPVVCSNVCSIPEVVGDAAILLAPHDVSGIVTAMASLVGDSGRRDALVARGRTQAARFSWTRAADETCVGYRSLMKTISN